MRKKIMPYTDQETYSDELLDTQAMIFDAARATNANGDYVYRSYDEFKMARSSWQHQSILLKAIEECERENSPLTDDQKFMLLGKALYDTAYQKLKKLSKYGRKYEHAEEDEYIQVECWKMYKEMEKILTTAKKFNKASGKSDADFNKEWIAVIRNMKGTIGNIVADLKAV